MLQQGRRRLLESGTAIEHRLCSPSVDGTRGGGGGGERTRGGLTVLSLGGFGGAPPRKFCNSR